MATSFDGMGSSSWLVGPTHFGGCCISAISCTSVIVVMDQHNTIGIVATNIPFGAMT